MTTSGGGNERSTRDRDCDAESREDWSPSNDLDTERSTASSSANVRKSAHENLDASLFAPSSSRPAAFCSFFLDGRSRGAFDSVLLSRISSLYITESGLSTTALSAARRDGQERRRRRRRRKRRRKRTFRYRSPPHNRTSDRGRDPRSPLVPRKVRSAILFFPARSYPKRPTSHILWKLGNFRPATVISCTL